MCEKLDAAKAAEAARGIDVSQAFCPAPCDGNNCWTNGTRGRVAATAARGKRQVATFYETLEKHESIVHGSGSSTGTSTS